MCKILEAYARVVGVEMERREQKEERLQWVGGGGKEGLTDAIGKNEQESKVAIL